MPWIERLRSTYRVVAIDLPGHGLTQAPAGYAASMDSFVEVVEAIARELGLPRFVIVGNSMGGRVSWQYALAHPQRLSGLVLIDSAGFADKRSANRAVLFRLMRIRVLRPLIRHLDVTVMARQGLKAAFFDERLVTPELVRRYTDLARGRGHREILISLPVRQTDRQLLERLSTIQTPTLVMVGEEDRLIPVAETQRFAEFIWGATLIRYPGVGHVPMEQIPDRSAHDLDRWIKTTVDLA